LNDEGEKNGGIYMMTNAGHKVVLWPVSTIKKTEFSKFQKDESINDVEENLKHFPLKRGLIQIKMFKIRLEDKFMKSDEESLNEFIADKKILNLSHNFNESLQFWTILVLFKEKKSRRILERVSERLWNQGQPWSESEDNLLSKEFNDKKSVSAIAKEHGRTRRAIEARLVRLRLL